VLVERLEERRNPVKPGRRGMAIFKWICKNEGLRARVRLSSRVESCKHSNVTKLP